LRPIYIDDGRLVLAHGIVVPEQPTPIHSHGTWGIVGVYRGQDRYQIWHRSDGNGAGPADVQLVRELILVPGDTIVIPPPPQDDVHAGVEKQGSCGGADGMGG
jgi:predicted metal-dependent enzyme (double-stranded beta helix superfamily)